jgi:flagellar hook-length control protein FliK
VGPRPAAGIGVTQSSSADPTQNAPAADHVDQTQLIQRIAHAFETAVERGGSIHLQLSPPELGSLRVELTLRNGAMSARMETETDAARTVLQDNLPALRERLAEHNIRVERFDIDLSGQSSGSLSGRSGNSSSRYDPSGGQSMPASSRVPSTAAASPTPTTAARPGTRSRFDVVV